MSEAGIDGVKDVFRAVAVKDSVAVSADLSFPADPPGIPSMFTPHQRMAAAIGDVRHADSTAAVKNARVCISSRLTIVGIIIWSRRTTKDSVRGSSHVAGIRKLRTLHSLIDVGVRPNHRKSLRDFHLLHVQRRTKAERQLRNSTPSGRIPTLYFCHAGCQGVDVT